ncbi:hypothetical protein LIER_17197 [Lithospermum erythrorhizon]|uniref:Uncharacterized protein n=1 Tax=Lithospermum erythrorhizon TaxID=34254 RepID=A0AAV3QAV2_LITER
MEDGSVFCKCEDGWTCTITKTDPTKAGKPFSDCAGGCSCDKKNESEGQPSEAKQVVVEGYAGSKAYCKCPEGFSCTISKIGDPTKQFFHCGEGCICVIEENNAFKAITSA